MKFRDTNSEHEHQHRARKRFGQNFLHDPVVIQRIINAIRPQPGQALVEIGPGQGAITAPLLKAAGELDVIELDRDLIPLLEKNFGILGNLRIHAADVLKFDFATLGADQRRLRVVGNLPYNISTPLIFHLLEYAHQVQDMYFMLQKEVAERLAAAPNTEHYGRLSVMVQYRCTVDILFLVGPGAFRPAPKVDSAFVRLTPHAQPPVHIEDEKLFAALVNQAFTQRRKTLRNALKGILTEEQIKETGIDPGLRPETLSLKDFAALSNLKCRLG